MIQIKFDTKKEAKEFVKEYLIKQIRLMLQAHNCDIMLPWYNNSKRTETLYVSLLYKKELYKELDPLAGIKFPYVIRISDHENISVFHDKMPDFDIIIRPYLPEADYKELKRLASTFQNLSRQLYIDRDSTATIMAQRERIGKRIEELKAKTKWQIDKDPALALKSISEIIAAQTVNG